MRRTLLLIFLTSLLLFCVSEKPQEGKTIATPTATPVVEKTPEVKEKVEKQLPRSECENCHNNEKRQYVPQAYKIEGHKNADYCISCHLSKYLNESKQKLLERLHEKHVTKAECTKCHREIGKSEWECLNCHGEDPFSPGNNLVDIHRYRGVLCEDCHGSDYLRIHMKKKPFPVELKPIPPKP